MSTRRKLMLSLAGVALLTIAISSFASGSYDAGAIYKAYTFSSYAKATGSGTITVKCTSLMYTGENLEDKNYHYAHPQSTGTSAKLYASQKKVYKYRTSSETVFDLNDSGLNAATYALRVKNAYYNDSNNTTTTVKMTVTGETY